MPAYHIQRSVTIDASTDKVMLAIHDFSQWPKWSPWLCMEPSAKLEVFGTPGTENHGYAWEGQVVGSGRMTMTSSSNTKLTMNLDFIKPFKSKGNRVEFELQELDSHQTKVTWHMHSKMPFFLFFMIDTMKAMIGMDYDRGLKMLKEYVEEGKVKSNIEVVGLVDVPHSHFVGVRDEVPLTQVSDSMSRTLPQAYKMAQAKSLEIAGPPSTVVNNFDIKKQIFDYTAAIPVKSAADIEAPAFAGEIKSCKAFKVVHTGSYDHLGNAWSTAMAYQRHQKLKGLKNQPPFESYINDPENTPKEDLKTEIYIPVRA